jgi:hypothetical protein
MSKLAKLQEEKLEKLKMLSSAGCGQLVEALSSEMGANIFTFTKDPLGGRARAPSSCRDAGNGGPWAKIGHLGEAIWKTPVCGGNEGFDRLSSRFGLRGVGSLANKSGKKGCKRPGLHETVQAALRLVQSRQWSSKEISQAFVEDVGMGE